ncbi:hypothetical protein JXJ21_16295 [candidate division KSB1 bacterium]|nr:hypothetical protein [candidate division KSB1 bacterium]
MKIKTIIPLILSILLSCAVFKFPFNKAIVAYPEYPGVKPQLAEEAERRSRNYFVSKEEEEESEKYAALGKSELSESESLLRAIDQLKARLKADTSKKAEKPKEKIVEKMTDDVDIVFIRTTDTTTVEDKAVQDEETLKILEKYGFEDELLTMLTQLYLRNAMESFRIAREKNQFNLQLTIQRAEIFHEKYGATGYDPEAYRKSAQELEKVIRFHKDEHDNFNRLGLNYEYLKDWKRAYENYKQALYVYDNVASLNVLPDSARTHQDTLEYHGRRFMYLTDKARAEMRLFMPDSALLSLYRATENVTNNQDFLFLQNSIKNILWDDKNIYAMMLRDSAYTLQNHQKYDSAHAVYVTLLDTLKTRQARDEILTDIALIEYLDFKQHEGALARIQNILKDADANPATRDFFEAPFEIDDFNYYYLDSTGTKLIKKDEPNDLFSVIIKNNNHNNNHSDSDQTGNNQLTTFIYDSTYKNIFRNIGQLYLDYAMEAQSKGRFEVARIYYDIITKIDWNGRGKGYLGLIPLHPKTDPRGAVKLCQKAFQYHNHLNEEERRKVFSYMVRLLKKMRKEKEARWVHNIRRRGGAIPWEDLIDMQI